MKTLLAALLLLSSCVEYRLSKPGIPDKYIGWSNSKPKLDPKVGPNVKMFFTDRGSIRPYIGGEIIHQEELLLGVGVVYYANENKSFEIGYRDSVYKDTSLLDEAYRNDRHYDWWDEMNPMFYIGGVVRF